MSQSRRSAAAIVEMRWLVTDHPRGPGAAESRRAKVVCQVQFLPTCRHVTGRLARRRSSLGHPPPSPTLEFPGPRDRRHRTPSSAATGEPACCAFSARARRACRRASSRPALDRHHLGPDMGVTSGFSLGPLGPHPRAARPAMHRPSRVTSPGLDSAHTGYGAPMGVARSRMPAIVLCCLYASR
jgi:hypothetical protein